jgi:hypothetical protein
MVSDTSMDNGRVPSGQALVASDQAASRLGPSGFDPSRYATLTVHDNEVMSCFWRHAIIAQLLDLQERESATRQDFQPAIKRAQVERLINNLFGIFECRSDDFAAAYAWVGFWEALGLDFWNSRLAFKDASAIEARSDATTKIGAAEGESAVAKPDAPAASPITSEDHHE